MFIQSQSQSLIRTPFTHAMVEAALKTNLNGKLEKLVADTFIKQRPVVQKDWTATIHSFKNRKIVSALMSNQPVANPKTEVQHP